MRKIGLIKLVAIIGLGLMLGGCAEQGIQTPSSTMEKSIEHNKLVFYDFRTNLMWQDNSAVLRNKTEWKNTLQYCKDLRLEGYRDWRLPNIYELVTLIDNTKQSKPRSIDGLVNIAEYSYWSSTDSTKFPGSKWIVHYVHGNINYNGVNWSSHVRCVRGKELNYDTLIALSKNNVLNVKASLLDEIIPNPSNQNSNTPMSKDIVTKEVFEDKVTGLVWQDDVDVVSSKKNFYTATTYCENLKKGKFSGYDDWRLPNIYELSTLLDNTNTVTSINGLKMASKHGYWSSTISNTNSSQVWSLGFGSGKNYDESKDTSNNVRCVSGKSLNYESLVGLKKKGVIKVAQSNIDDVSPAAEAKRKKEAEIVAQREAKERAEREKQEAKERAEKEKIAAKERKENAENERINKLIHDQIKKEFKFIAPSNSICEKFEGWSGRDTKLNVDGCIAEAKNAEKICQKSGGRLMSEDEFRKLAMYCNYNFSKGYDNRKNTKYINCLAQYGIRGNIYHLSNQKHCSITSVLDVFDSKPDDSSFVHCVK